MHGGERAREERVGREGGVLSSPEAAVVAPNPMA